MSYYGNHHFHSNTYTKLATVNIEGDISESKVLAARIFEGYIPVRFVVNASLMQLSSRTGQT